MSADLKTSALNGENAANHEECQKKIAEVRAMIKPLPEKFSGFCSDQSIARYLRARNWNVKKAAKMLKETLKWRLQYKPEQIYWEDIAAEAESGKIYRSTSVDKKGRPVLVMRPSCQNTNSVAGQIKYFVYCMENAIQNLPPSQEQMVWLVDFKNFNLTNISIKSTKETAHVLQNHYPERLGVAIMYNPPRIFKQFYTVAKCFLEPKTRNKVKFVYSDDLDTKKIMEELFDMDQLESAFGGNFEEGFEIHKYSQRMKIDDETRCAPLSCNGLTNVSLLSDKEVPFEEEGDQDSDSTSTPLSAAEDSPGVSPDVNLSVTAMSLADSKNVKAC